MQEQAEKLVYTRTEAAQVLGIGTTTFDQLVRREQNPIPHVRLGRKIMVPVDALKAWLQNGVDSEVEE